MNRTGCDIHYLAPGGIGRPVYCVRAAARVNKSNNETTRAGLHCREQELWGVMRRTVGSGGTAPVVESKFDLVAALLKAGEAWETGGRHTEPHLSSKISSSVNFSKMWAACTLPPVQSSNPSFSLESRSFVFMC